MHHHFVLSLTIFLFYSAYSQKAGQDKMDFETYNPASTLAVPEHHLQKAKFPFIDVHNHQWDVPGQDIGNLFSKMNGLNMKVMINLSGKSYKETPGKVNGDFDVRDNDYLHRSIDKAKIVDGRRLLFFTNISFVDFGTKEWIKNAVAELEKDVLTGACGLKMYKDFGMFFKDGKGEIIAVDDERLNPLWEKCGELKIPVIIHTADPKPFWDDMDEHNERWLELATHPDRKRTATDPAPWQTLMEQQHRLFARHPKTNFIAAHFGWYANNLQKLDSLLTAMPNMYVEFGAVIAELGRQPRMAKVFFEKFQDRILFGKDNWVPDEYATYFRVLETEDEYFPYHKKYHAFWRMYGMGLPDSILKKVYYKNAIKIIPGIDKTMFPE
jgi:uncharacterized protein